MSSTRDVLATAMGYDRTATSQSLGYVFNRLGVWDTPDVTRAALGELEIDETLPTPEFPEVWACGMHGDTYRDARGRLHVLYFFRGAETQGRQCLRHAIIDNGRLVNIVTLPPSLDRCFALADAMPPAYGRIIQDTTGRFYLIGTAAIVPADSADGTQLGDPVPLDLGGHVGEYSGIAIAAPRSGTRLADEVDAVFPTNKGKSVVYLRICLRN